MKTLDEVIKAYEICTEEQPCSLCPYIKSDANGKWACALCGDCTFDALHYLKEYKNTDENYKKAIAHVTEVIDHYEKMVADYLAVNNPPLTWDELKQMEGKPVWVEFFYEDGQHFDSDWFLVGFVSESFCDVIGKLGTSRLVKNDYWQAYRKERK